MKIKKVVMSFSLMVFLIGLVSAFGVSTFYWEGNPVKLAPGETATVDLLLQNMVGTEDYTFEAEMKNNGNGIAEFVYEDNTYFVPAKTRRLEVPIRISIPEDTKYGETRTIHVSFVPKVDEEGGMVQLISAVGSTFPVEIVAEKESTFYTPEPEPEIVEKGSSNTIFYIVVVVLLLVIIYLLTHLRKKRK